VFSQNGKKIFEANCVACHTIGKGHLVGPDLKGVTANRNEDWLMKWIKSSQTLIRSKDPLAVALYNQNNQIVMPDQPFSDDQIKALLDYIKTGNTKDAIANDTKGKDNKSVSEVSGNVVVTANNNPSNNNTSPPSTAVNSTNETSQTENKSASISPNVVNNTDKAEESKPSNPDRMFLFTGIIIVLGFFIAILVTMVMVIKALLTALGKKYEKELQ
jgi:cytochrome c551/c552